VQKVSVPMRPTKDPAACLPGHELARLDAAHPERTTSDPEAAARTIVGRTYVEDLRHSSSAANAALSRELEAEDL
jgi:hypothetical protein